MAADPMRDSTNLLPRMASGNIRILQLLDLDAGFQAQRGAVALARELGEGFTASVRAIGLGGDYANVFTAIRGMRELEYDLIHAWGGAALTAAVMQGKPIVYSPSDTPSRRSLRWMRAVMDYRNVQVICATSTLRRTCVERGVPLERCHLIRPGVEFARIRRRRNPDLRAALGFAEQDRVMLLAGESTRSSGHRAALWAAAILHVMEPHRRVLAWGRGDQTRALAAFARAQKQPELLCLAEQRLGRRIDFEELLPAADLVLATPTGPIATLPISITMAAALPIVATVSYTIGELLEDRHTALLAQAGSPRALARRVLDLEEDSNLQWSISDMARTEAYEYFTQTRFVNQYRGVYRQVSERAQVEVPEMAPGVGLRFHGRG